MLVSSSVAESDFAVWSAATTYAVGDRVIDTTTHRIYQSVQATNLNHAVSDVAWWLDIGPTNRWAMFDGAVGTVTTGTSPIAIVIQPTQSVSSIALMDLVETSTVQIAVTHSAATIYDKTYSMADKRFLAGWWDYFFMPLANSTTLIVNDLPPVGQITITINGTGCGTLVIGNIIDIGKTLTEPSVSIIDYSRKETDPNFGVTTIVKRSFAKKIDARFWFTSNRVDYVSMQLTAIRATPVVWLTGDGSNIESLTAYGIFRDWGIDIQYPNYSEASIQIEGLI
jgi:hypothetical protein